MSVGCYLLHVIYGATQKSGILSRSKLCAKQAKTKEGKANMTCVDMHAYAMPPSDKW